MILQILSRLIDYPSEQLQAHKDEILELIHQDASLSQASKNQLNEFLADKFAMNLLDWQAEYEALFERGRSLSLLLFEHVHGESRDRGQAMINLIEQYKQAGLNLSAKELPDYIPLYLEFVSTQPLDAQSGWLQDVAHIIGLLTARLQKRESDYHIIFSALLELSNVPIELDDIHQQIKNEQRDDTQEAIDKVWEEEAITFGADQGGAGGCATATNHPSASQDRSNDLPISFTDATHNLTNQVRDHV